MRKKFLLSAGVALLLLLLFAAPVSAASDKPVYRLYNANNGEHLYTTDANEKEVLYKQQNWGYEGIGWYTATSGTPVYRLYQPGLGNHLYTTDKNEVNTLCSKYGWKKDNNGKPLFYSSGSTPIYRVYNKAQSGMHHLTTDKNEYNTLPKYRWKKEGVAMYATRLGQQQTTAYYNLSTPKDGIYLQAKDSDGLQPLLVQSNGNGTYRIRVMSASSRSNSVITYKPGVSTYAYTCSDLLDKTSYQSTLTFTKVNSNQVAFYNKKSNWTFTYYYYGKSFKPRTYTGSYTDYLK